MPGFPQPGSEPAAFIPLPLPAAAGHYVTVVARNHRIVQVGGTAGRPVLVRESLHADGFTALTDGILEELRVVDGLSLCFVGHGFDPSTVAAADDEEAMEHSAAWAAVVFVPPGTLPALRRAVAGALVDHGLPNAWVLATQDDGDGIVVRAGDRMP